MRTDMGLLARVYEIDFSAVERASVRSGQASVSIHPCRVTTKRTPDRQLSRLAAAAQRFFFRFSSGRSQTAITLYCVGITE